MPKPKPAFPFSGTSIPIESCSGEAPCPKSRGATHTQLFFKSNAYTHTSRTKKKNDTRNIHSAGSQPRWGRVGVACGAKRARHIWASASVAVPRRNALSFFLPREPAPRHATHTRPLSTHCSALPCVRTPAALCQVQTSRMGPLWTLVDLGLWQRAAHVSRSVRVEGQAFMYGMA